MQVEQRRGSFVESVHRVHVAVVDAQGTLVARSGDPDLVTFWRSAAKPFQALPLVLDGIVDRFHLTREDLALACASHSSEARQVDLVREFLQRVGCSERDLRCGPHTPLSDAVAKDYETRGVRLSAIYSNCSGKHTGMLALARGHDWPTEFYWRPEHPVQQRCLAEVSRWSGVAAERIGMAVDGCGVVCFALPLRNMALAYARLTIADFGLRIADSQRKVDPGSDLASPIRNPQSTIRNSQSAFRTPHSVVEAMLRHPDLIAGEGRPCTDMMRAHPGRVITKVGADGVYSAVLVHEGLGITLKVEDGHGPSAALAIAAVLEQLGLHPQPASLAARPTLNTRGETVGELRVSGELER